MVVFCVLDRDAVLFMVLIQVDLYIDRSACARISGWCKNLWAMSINIAIYY